MRFIGATVSDAITNGLDQLKCNREDVVIRIVNEGSVGLFGLTGSKPAVVLILPRNDVCKSIFVVDNDPKNFAKKTKLLYALKNLNE